MSKESVLLFVGLAGLLYYPVPRESDYAPSGVGGGGAPVVISPNNFESEVIESPVPVLAYFWASW
ncbi:hypothetical protein N9260_01485 [bacterium]|nr:hypothetical protein [bacterium]